MRLEHTLKTFSCAEKPPCEPHHPHSNTRAHKLHCATVRGEERKAQPSKRSKRQLSV